MIISLKMDVRTYVEDDDHICFYHRSLTHDILKELVPAVRVGPGRRDAGVLTPIIGRWWYFDRRPMMIVLMMVVLDSLSWGVLRSNSTNVVVIVVVAVVILLITHSRRRFAPRIRAPTYHAVSIAHCFTLAPVAHQRRWWRRQLHAPAVVVAAIPVYMHAHIHIYIYIKSSSKIPIL